MAMGKLWIQDLLFAGRFEALQLSAVCSAGVTGFTTWWCRRSTSAGTTAAASRRAPLLTICARADSSGFHTARCSESSKATGRQSEKARAIARESRTQHTHTPNKQTKLSSPGELTGRCRTRSWAAQAKGYRDLGEYMCSDPAGLVRVEQIKRFDKLDFIFLDGDLPLLPWSPDAEQVSSPLLSFLLP
eukprot:3550579-Rhodomonas_salina.1